MTTDLTRTVPQQQLVAVTAGEIGSAQAQVAGWCKQKIHALAAELRDQRENLRQAKALKWRHTGWARAVTKTKGLMVYYAKIQHAVRAGYLIVPNFDVELIAVRTAKATPDDAVDRHRADPQALPPGRGRYVDDQVRGYKTTRTITRSDKTTCVVTDFHPTAFNEQIDFPVALVKPVILAATEHAMAWKLFDRIGIVRRDQKSDPIVIGQILKPTGDRSHTYVNRPTCVSFFIAWWLDTQDL